MLLPCFFGDITTDFLEGTGILKIDLFVTVLTHAIRQHSYVIHSGEELSCEYTGNMSRSAFSTVPHCVHFSLVMNSIPSESSNNEKSDSDNNS